MTQKQREDHIQAKYWNGFITRTEAQKVFDEQAEVIDKQAMIMQVMDFTLGCIADKLGITPEDVNNFVKAKMEAAKAAQPPQEAPSPEQPKLVVEA